MSEQAVPEWAAFFTPERLALFGEVLERSLETLNKPFVMNLNEGSLRVLNSESGHVYGLVNLAQICNQVPVEDWSSVVTEFLASLTKVHLADDVPTDFESVRPLLRIRMFAVENFNRSQMVTWPVADEFLTCLTVDLPDKVATVTQAAAKSYGHSKDELYDIAMRNVFATTEAERHDVPVSDGAEVITFSGSSFFVASLSLGLDVLLGEAPPLGRLVAIPNRHNVLCATITDDRSLDSLGLLVQAARGMFVEGPGSITPYVYWVRNGGWKPLELDLSEQGLAVEGPDSFIETVLIPLLG